MFDAFLRERGYRAMGGQIFDASIVPVPTQRNSREENAELRAGDIPAGWVEGSANRLAQKDLDARWTKRGGVSRYGYQVDTMWRAMSGLGEMQTLALAGEAPLDNMEVLADRLIEQAEADEKTVHDLERSRHSANLRCRGQEAGGSAANANDRPGIDLGPERACDKSFRTRSDGPATGRQQLQAPPRWWRICV